MIPTGKIVKSFREEKNLKMYQISDGLCSISYMTKFEKGKRLPDALLFEYLLERIGVFTEEFSIMATKEEYIFFTWRRHIYNSIEEKNWKKLKELSEDGKILLEVCNVPIVKQIILYANGIVEANENKNWEKAFCCLKQAVIQTNPKLFETLETKVKLGIKELHLLMFYLFYGVQAKMIDKIDGVLLFYKLEKYIDSKDIEDMEKVKIYPKLICIALQLFQEEIEVKEQVLFCEKAISLLRSTHRFYDVTEVLRHYIILLKETNSDKLCFYEKQYQNFMELYERSGTDSQFCPECLICLEPKIYLITEYLYSKRMEKQLTQQEVSEGIYEPESYSRVERGVTKPFPKKLQLLAEKLEINWCYYRGELETDNPEVYRLRIKHRVLDIKNRREESLEILEQMESLLDMNENINRQYIKSHKIWDLYCLGEMSQETAKKNLEELLRLTKIIDFETEYLVYYSQTEVEIIGYIASVLRKQKKYEEGIYLITTVLNQMKRSQVQLDYHKSSIMFILRVLSGLYFACEKYELSNEVLKYVYNSYISLKRGENLSHVLDAMADNFEHMGVEYAKEYKVLYRQTFYIADFFEIRHVKRFIGTYYAEHFGKNILLY